MDTFNFIHDQVKKKMGFTCYYIPDSELSLIKKQVNRGLMSPIQAEKRITRFYSKLKIKTTQSDRDWETGI